MKNWFENVRTLDELKAAYRKLAIIHHPDKGGRTEDMQEINAEFDRLFPVYKLQYNVTASAQTHETAETVRREFYTANGWKGVNYDANRDLKTIAASVRKYVKETYPTYRFSVRTSYASMCQKLHVDMTEAPMPVYKTLDQLTRDDVSAIISRANHNNVWPLTCWSDAEARAEIARIWENEDGDWFKIVADEIRAVATDVDDFVNSFNYSDCDSMIDYFDVNFYYFGCLDGNGRYVKHVPREDKRRKLLADESSAAQNAPAKATDTAPATVLRVSFCPEHDGLEVYFSGRPSDDLRAALKADGWRWHSAKKCWYNRNTEQHLQTLRELTA